VRERTEKTWDDEGVSELRELGGEEKSAFVRKTSDLPYREKP
jgi:hypothetical protein